MLERTPTADVLIGPFAGLKQRHYGVVLADPPWHFKVRSAKGEGRSACQHYSVMSFDAIAELPVQDVAADDSWLFLWVPGPHLPQGLQLIECWGFSYSGTGFVWAKQNPSGVGWHMGTGYGTRKNAELCLQGRRGRPKRKARNVRELIVAPRREHSRKPDEVYEHIERLCGVVPRLELFARQARENWTPWGDEVEIFAAPEGAS